nr:ribonuclease III domain-containing protein [Caloranaerobacter azorensis]
MIFGGSGWDKNKVKMLSPLQLAYIGDAIYELLIRTYLLSKKNISVNELHKEAVKYVKAKAQADIVHNLQDKLTEEEWSIIKRGRNAKSGSAPKNAELIDYKYATGFETLMGFLYLIGDNERIYEIFNMIINMYAENEG